MNYKYYKKYLEYKKKCRSLEKSFYKQYAGGDGSIKNVAAVLFHSDETGKQILLVKRIRDEKWMTPGGHVDYKDYKNNDTNEKSYLTALKREFKEETGIDMPKVKNMKSYVYKGYTKLYIGDIGHIDLGKYKRNNETESIGLFNIDM